MQIQWMGVVMHTDAIQFTKQEIQHGSNDILLELMNSLRILELIVFPERARIRLLIHPLCLIL